MLLKRGAEAELRRVEWHGRPAVEKVRVPKAYRHETLDEQLRKVRLRTEARLMSEARSLGLRVPILYDIDLTGNRLGMEFLEGASAKDLLQQGRGGPAPLAREIGELAGTLHANGIVHGDLTTSNMIVHDHRLYLIDFSMGEKTDSVEAKGVDLRLLKEAWMSAHFVLEGLFESEVLAGYREKNPGATDVIAKLAEIEARGRYT